MICLKDPFITISEHSKNLIESEYVLAARKEKFETIEMEKIIKNLQQQINMQFRKLICLLLQTQVTQSPKNICLKLLVVNVFERDVKEKLQ